MRQSLRLDKLKHMTNEELSRSAKALTHRMRINHFPTPSDLDLNADITSDEQYLEWRDRMINYCFRTEEFLRKNLKHY